jgi:hypothetical protein
MCAHVVHCWCGTILLLLAIPVLPFAMCPEGLFSCESGIAFNANMGPCQLGHVLFNPMSLQIN